jgi:hypothetical protein
MDRSPFKFKLPSAMLALVRQERQPHSTGTRTLISYRVLVVVTTSQLLYRVLEVPCHYGSQALHAPGARRLRVRLSESRLGAYASVLKFDHTSSSIVMLGWACSRITAAAAWHCTLRLRLLET